ncbi:PREDICTED: MICOS complex subunit Mic19-like isoform X2 [Priapulus caudatus]|uniref:MICOS complex subunit Mic19-like isoform X2 n=1 Tax=Priapulus caudatus TaxID=37621 RepID=A0ABM1DUS5_PRICU|nr:PREDICTED: MICOS complex subunit Mic19-like isoform X2 [Priapulus caudatus]
MGGTSSTRRVTVEMEDEDGNGVVKISESMARRLAGEGDSSPREPRKAQHVSQPALPSATAPKMVPPMGYPVPSGISQQEHEEEIRRIESYYKERQHALEQRNVEQYSLTKEEFENALKQVHAKFVKQPKTPICGDMEERVMKCYEANRGQTLLCSQEAKAFVQCVDHTRGVTKIIEQNLLVLSCST